MRNQFILIKNDGEKIENPKIDGLKVFFSGEENYVEIHEGSKFINTTIKVSNQSKVIIKRTHPFGIKNSTFAAAGRSKGNYILVDTNFYISNSGRLVCEGTDNAGIIIGKNNMWSSDIVIRASDSHQLFDLKTLDTFNFARETVIGDNVWIGSQAVIMKGVHIPNGSVVGQSSVVTKKFVEENTVIVGNPARVAKRNVGWSQDYVWDVEEIQNLDLNRKKQILSLRKPLTGHWSLTSETEKMLSLSRISSVDRDRWLKFNLDDELIAEQSYYFVLEFKTNVSTQFTLFLSDSSNNIFRFPSFWAKRNQLRKIIFPFQPDIKKLKYISLSASHFPEESLLELFDFRVEKIAKNII